MVSANIKGCVSSNIFMRTISALVLAPVVLAAVYFGGVAFSVLVMVAACLMFYEWDKMWNLSGRFYVVLSSAIVCLSLYLAMQRIYEDSAEIVFLGLLILLLGFAKSQNNSIWQPIGILYIFLPCFSLIWLRNEAGLELTLWLLVCVWATDIGAYIAGKIIGGPKIAPSISPSKTWAGLVGGIVSSVGATALLLHYSYAPINTAPLVLASLVTVVAQAGDFFESWMKRKSGVKDSGSIIPGHGGILDRVDGLLAASVFIAALYYIFTTFMGSSWWH